MEGQQSVQAPLGQTAKAALGVSTARKPVLGARGLDVTEGLGAHGKACECHVERVASHGGLSRGLTCCDFSLIPTEA